MSLHPAAQKALSAPIDPWMIVATDIALASAKSYRTYQRGGQRDRWRNQRLLCLVASAACYRERQRPARAKALMRRAEALATLIIMQRSKALKGLSAPVNNTRVQIIDAIRRDGAKSFRQGRGRRAADLRWKTTQCIVDVARMADYRRERRWKRAKLVQASATRLALEILARRSPCGTPT